MILLLCVGLSSVNSSVICTSNIGKRIFFLESNRQLVKWIMSVFADVLVSFLLMSWKLWFAALFVSDTGIQPIGANDRAAFWCFAGGGKEPFVLDVAAGAMVAAIGAINAHTRGHAASLGVATGVIELHLFGVRGAATAEFDFAVVENLVINSRQSRWHGGASRRMTERIIG